MLGPCPPHGVRHAWRQAAGAAVAIELPCRVCCIHPRSCSAPAVPYAGLLHKHAWTFEHVNGTKGTFYPPPAGGHSVGSEVGGVPQEGFTFYLRPDDGSPMSINSLDVRFVFFFSFFPWTCVAGCRDAVWVVWMPGSRAWAEDVCSKLWHGDCMAWL